MLRKTGYALAVLILAGVVARSEEFIGSIRKVEDGKITVASDFDKETRKFAKERTLTVAENVKVVSAKFNKEEKKVEPGDPLKDGLKNERFAKIGKFGVFAQIVTNDDGQVTEIRVFPGFKGKGKKGK